MKRNVHINSKSTNNNPSGTNKSPYPYSALRGMGSTDYDEGSDEDQRISELHSMEGTDVHIRNRFWYFLFGAIIHILYFTLVYIILWVVWLSYSKSECPVFQ